MGCACGKPFVIEDSRGSPRQRLPASRLPAAADAPAKRMAAAVSSLRREEVVGVRVDAVAQVVAVEKRVGSGPIRANGMDADRRRAMERPAHRNHPMQVIGSVPKAVEGEQVAAGWPPWLAAVAGEAIRGWVPRRADSFEKLDKIGQGTYSNVYRARDLDNKKIVALKKVRFDNLEPESVKFMAREILILRRLDHPNIVKLEGLVTSRTLGSSKSNFEAKLCTVKIGAAQNSRRQSQSNSRSRSEKFSSQHEEVASGFPIEPPRVTPVLEVSEEPQNQFSNRSFHSGPLVHRSQLPKAWKNEDLPKVSAIADSSGLPGPATARRKVVSNDGNEDFIAQLGGHPSGRLSESGNESDGKKCDQMCHQREDERSNIGQPTDHGPKGNKIHYSGPLLHPSGNVDQMLKEHDRQIQEVFRRARINKSKIRKVQGDGNQLGVKPSDFIAMPVYPSSRGSSVPVFTSSRGPAQ
ncbi:hypothetical protein B296_00024538 [Ensete ventricosum]|uniref:[RNA-polymerase]-subunit kinase n=1 Tax=Ensete ventricosum TaxID=4639 RepID=A0A426ZYJ8_ENSVE|nr:hypothetical protein B296_00024538 [Ensete ventricosum]